jgi:Lon protease-like protein
MSLIRDAEILPLFPLAGLVAFPGAELPLHIFEERYRQMTTDVLDRRGLFLLATALGVDFLAPLAALVRIRDYQQLDDGRYLLDCEVLERVAIEENPSPHLYRVARAYPRPLQHLLAEDETAKGDFIAFIARRFPEAPPLPRETPADSLSPLLALLCQRSSLSVEDRLRLLACDSEGDMVRQMIAKVEVSD